jgi:cellulose synthase/poly-beta-1,6-N-acetylglucosamine synthase-like glycosyltransferase
MNDCKYLPQAMVSLAEPTVSWLICSHVADDYLKLAIDSCLSQSYEDFEIIFVANGKNASFVSGEVQK